MPKKKKPTPAQGFLLRAMKETEGALWFEEKTHYRPFIGCIGMHPYREHSFRIPTIRACIKYGWLEIDQSLVGEYYSRQPDESFGYRISELGLESLESMKPKDFEKPNNGKSDGETTREIEAALYKKYAPKYTRGEWAYFLELAVSTGDRPQRLDGFAINCWPSRGFEVIVFEIKASRGDLLHELKSPMKSIQGKDYGNRFYFVTPPGLFKDAEEIPGDCGLMELTNNKLITVKEAPYTKAADPTWGLVASIARRTANDSEESDENYLGGEE